jgi:NAD(P)H-hydrate repair Nnr-like enzyme with NAD(P)H-hydrate epimerase domain
MMSGECCGTVLILCGGGNNGGCGQHSCGRVRIS